MVFLFVYREWVFFLLEISSKMACLRGPILANWQLGVSRIPDVPLLWVEFPYKISATNLQRAEEQESSYNKIVPWLVI